MKRLGVLGASGAVGEVMVRLLEQRAFPLASVKFLASPRSAGKTIVFGGDKHPVIAVSDKEFEGLDILLSSTPASISKLTSPAAALAGAVVIDNSSAWRMDPTVPLVVPEVNPHDIDWNKALLQIRTARRFRWSWLSSQFTTNSRSSESL